MAKRMDVVQLCGCVNVVIMCVSLIFGLVTMVLLVLNITQYNNLLMCHNSTPSLDDENDFVVTSWFGVVLTVIGNCINAVGISVQKYAHIKLGASASPNAYFRDRRWWIGLLLVALGEGLNAVAYGYAPTNIIAPLGGLTLVVTDAIAVVVFREMLRLVDVLGAILILVGVGLITSSTNSTTPLYTAYELLSTNVLGSTQSIIWICILIFAFAALIFVTRYKRTNSVSVWAVTAASLSSFTIIACRGFFSMLALINEDCSGLLCDDYDRRLPRCTQTVGNWLFWFLLGLLLVTAFVANAQIEQHGIRHFKQSLWVPMHFAFCTILFTLSGAFVFDDFNGIQTLHVILFTVGLILVLLGVAMILWLRHYVHFYLKII